jgi:zinc protease
MFRKLFTFILLFILISSCAVFNSPNSPEELKLNSKIKTGILENGLTYYVMENARPEKRAELMLLVNAGSILEEDHQQGIAHFTEHMAFNGTKRFPKQELVNYLESIGLKFGPDLNAFTSFDMTVYMLQVPSDEKDKFDTGLMILEDWAHNLSMDNEEIDKERGVVLEELRIGKGARERMLNKKLPVYLKDSKYANRLPIGKEEILKTFDYSSAKDFYKDWYRPDLMAIVAVGDFNGEEVVQQIKTQFSNIPKVENSKERKEFSVPIDDISSYLVITDPEATSSSVGISYKFPKPNSENIIDEFKNSILINMMTQMFNNRLSELTQNPQSSLIYGYNYRGSWVRTIDGFNVGAGVKPGMVLNGLEEILTELERIKQFGFTESEFDRQKKSILKSIETQFNEKDKQDSDKLRWEFLELFFENKIILGIEKEYELAQHIIPNLKVSDLNKYIEQIKESNCRVITADCPDKKGVINPTDDELKQVDLSIKTKEIFPYEDDVIDSPLLSEIPPQREIIDFINHKEIDGMEFILENGVRVIIKPTDFKNDEILFEASSPGGSSLVSNNDFISAKYASDIISESGIGEFSKIELKKYLSGKQVSVSPYINELTEGFSGSTSVDDVETMFQLIYQYFHSPRKDIDAFTAYIENMKGMVENRSARPENVYRDSISVIMNNRHFRAKPVSTQLLDEVNINTAFNVYKDRFSDASDFTFIFVGSINPQTFIPLVQTYLGNLPSKNRSENWKDVGIRYPQGNIEKIINRGIEEKSSVQIRYSGKFDWNRDNRYIFKTLTSSFMIKLREILREDMGGTYGVYVGGYPDFEPIEAFQSIIAFGCGPENVEPMVNEVFKQIENLKKEGLDQTYLDKVLEADKVEYEKNLKENSYWLNVISSYNHYGEPLSQILEREELYKLITNENIIKGANMYFNSKNVLKAYLYPEKK